MHRRLLLLLFVAIIAGCGGSQVDFQKIEPPTDSWFVENVTSQPVPVIVDFYASWCGPCKMLKPFLEKLEGEYDGKIRVVPIDVDARGDLAGHYGVGPIPYMLIFRDGKPVAECRGAPPTYEELKEWAAPHLK